MKKIALLSLALILALGSLGVGYASWHDTVTVGGPVTTGTVCLGFVKWWDGGPYIREESGDPDLNFTTWIAGPGPSCPPEGMFFGIHQTDPGKDVGYLGTVTPHFDVLGNVESLDVTIENAYPYFMTYLTVLVENCGTIPVQMRPPVISQDPSLLIEYFDGAQIEPGGSHEISFRIGVTQHVGHYVNDVWVIDDPLQPLTAQNANLSFTIAMTGDQWNE